MLSQAAFKAAKKTVELLKSEDEKADRARFEETWICGDTTILCRPCLRFADLDDVPKKLTSDIGEATLESLKERTVKATCSQ